MLLILFSTLLIAGMTAMFVRQGLFSSLIAAVLSLVCAAFALNAYPALASIALYDRQGPIANGVALTALFVLSLLLTREVANLLVPKAVRFPLLADRIGGGVAGFFASLTMVGVLVVILQLLPMGRSVLGYERYDDTLQRQAGVWPFFPDDFAVAVGQLGSIGAFGGEGSFNDMHDDLLREAFAARNTAGSNGTTFATPKSMTVNGAFKPTWEQLKTDLKIEDLPKDPLLDGMEGEYILVGTRIDNECGDEDNITRLAGTQLRLVAGKPVGQDANGPLGGPIDHYPIAYFYLSDKDANSWRVIQAPSGDGGAQIGKLRGNFNSGRIPLIYWVYVLGRGERPNYMVFRQVCKVDVPKPKPEEMPANPHLKKAADPTTVPTR